MKSQRKWRLGCYSDEKTRDPNTVTFVPAQLPCEHGSVPGMAGALLAPQICGDTAPAAR